MNLRLSEKEHHRVLENLQLFEKVFDVLKDIYIDQRRQKYLLNLWSLIVLLNLYLLSVIFLKPDAKAYLILLKNSGRRLNLIVKKP